MPQDTSKKFAEFIVGITVGAFVMCLLMNWFVPAPDWQSYWDKADVDRAYDVCSGIHDHIDRTKAECEAGALHARCSALNSCGVALPTECIK